jgi:hypothetical protein
LSSAVTITGLLLGLLHIDTTTTTATSITTRGI